MAQITLQGNPIITVGSLPAVNSFAPEFLLTRTDLSEARLKDFAGQTVILNITPSIDTSICAASARRFNTEVNNFDNTVALYISADLPFAHQRFCEAEGLKNIIPLSVFRSPDFGIDYGVTMIDGPLAGLLARAVIIVDTVGKVIYTEQVPEIAQDPDYEAALKVLSK